MHQSKAQRISSFILLVATLIAAEEQPNYAPEAAKPPYKAAAPAMPHSFAWSVKDEATNNDYSHQQESDGKVTSGSYRVAMPDGRTQIVTYRADDNGYVAQVKYEGEAISKYLEYRTSSSSYDNNTPSYSGIETTTASIIPAQKDYKDLEQNARYE